MSYQVDAIYDGGVLKPLTPLSLADQAHVKLTIEAGEVSVSAQDELASQQAALEELSRAIEALPPTSRNDNWSVRQHDAILYSAPE
jgi:predicted DNA-binding antitoxin AbrB/MazE fold protein